MSATSPRELMARATQLHRVGELDAAKATYRDVLALQPGNADALHLFGLVCHQQGDHRTAVDYIGRAVAHVPNHPVLRNNFGDALHRMGDLAGAITQLRKALVLRPDYAGAHQNLGSVLAKVGDHEAALIHGREATRLDPAKPEAWFDLGLLLMDQLSLEESMQAFRQALALRPSYRGAANSLLYLLNMMPGMNPTEVADAHREVASGLFRAIPQATHWPTPGEKIRIGFVSGDFRAHAVNCFFEPVLEHQDRGRFETFCYSDVVHEDEVTRRLRGQAQHWRNISGWTDEAVTGQIRKDRIDILVDLAGYTEHGRLGVFAGKPACCQISYIGYPNTTGMSTMDFRIVDACTAPVGETELGSERLLRVEDGFACFRPPAHAVEMRIHRDANSGPITFGSLHKLEKINTEVIATWAAILHANPDSRLLLARDQLDAWHQQRLLQAFEARGVDAGRLQMLHLSDPTQSFFEIFSRMDILLDVFPWSGHTIACCALWMGVPVVSLRGNTHAGRMVASVLESLKLPELIATDTLAYVQIAGALSRDKERLSKLRMGLRQRMEQSPLRDEAGFTRRFEAACLWVLAETQSAVEGNPA